MELYGMIIYSLLFSFLIAGNNMDDKLIISREVI